MEKKYAFLFAFMITGLIASDVYLFSALLSPIDTETVVIKRVLDGDTLDLEDGRRIRMLNINAPEKNQPLSQPSMDYLEEFLNKSIEIHITGTEIYGRYLARVYSGEYINLEMIKLGLVHLSHIEESEQSEFMKAQNKAFENELGIWKRSPYYGCLKIEINKKDEYLVIDNTCKVSFPNLALKDESIQTLYFSMPENAKLKLFSGQGESAGSQIYLGSRRHIWNDDKDTIFIRESNGLLVYYDNYGY